MSGPRHWLIHRRYNWDTGQRELVGTYTVGDSQRAGSQNTILEVFAGKYVNQGGVLSIRANTDHPLANNLQEDDRFDLWRSWPGQIPKYIFTTGYYQDSDYQLETAQQGTITVHCFDRYSLLRRHLCYYPADTTLLSVFEDVRAGSIIDRLTRFNLTSEGGTTVDPITKRTSAGRLMGVPIGNLWYSFASGASTTTGELVSLAAHLADLEELFVEVAELGKIDIDIDEGGEDAFTVRVFSPTRGQDRRPKLEFSLERGTLRSPRVSVRNSSVASHAIAGGQGSKNQRTFSPVTVSQAYLTGASRRYAELWEDGRVAVGDSLKVLSEIAALALLRNGPVRFFDLGVIQRNKVRFDVDYFLGDIGQAVFAGFREPVKVIGAELSLQARGTSATEELQVIVESYNGA